MHEFPNAKKTENKSDPGSEKLPAFREALKGWRTSPDGDDYCPDCWPKYLNQFEQKFQKMIKEDSCPTSDVAKYRRASDGWFAICVKCDKIEAVPYGPRT